MAIKKKWQFKQKKKVRCIGNDFVTENGVGIQQRSIRGVLQRFLTENVWIFTRNM